MQLVFFIQRIQPSGSFGSRGRNSASSSLFISNSEVTSAPEHNRRAGGHQSDMLAVPSSMDIPPSSGRSGTLDLFAEQVVSQPMASSTVDLFQLPTKSASTFSVPHASMFESHMPPSSFQSSTRSQPPVDYFGNNSPDSLLRTNLEQESSEFTVVKNEGWATFDTVPVGSSLGMPLVKEAHKSDTVSHFSEKTLGEPLQCDNTVQANNVDTGPYPPVPSPWSDVMQQQSFVGSTLSQVSYSGSFSATIKVYKYIRVTLASKTFLLILMRQCLLSAAIRCASF